MAIAVYPGTFDPLTGGHEDLVRRASPLFERVIVGVADSMAKNPIFNVDERVEIAREVLTPLGNVEVRRFSGLMVNFLRACNATVVLRGLRGVTDFDYEFQLAGMNRSLMPELETLFMTPSDTHRYVSGTLVREIAMMGGDINAFVAPQVKEWIDRKLAERRRAAAAARG